MYIIYISYDPLPTEKAHGINIVKTCEALASAGVLLELVMPRTRHSSGNDIFSFYKLRRVFTTRLVFSFDGVRLNLPFGFWLRRFSFAAAVALFLCIHSRQGIVVLTRDEISAAILRMLGYRVFYDMHGFPERKRWFWRFAMRSVKGIIVTNSYKIIQCRDIFEIPESRMIVAPNGFDPRLFSDVRDITKAELRQSLGLPTRGKLVIYTGSLYDWKGAEVLLETARGCGYTETCMPEDDSLVFVFVGGDKKECARFRAGIGPYSHIHVLGHRPYYDIPKFLKAADVLVLPNSARSKEARFATYSQHDTSPIKLFEYMASGTPIVASSLPSIHEVLSSDSALFVRPDNSAMLLEGIRAVLADETASARRAANAMRDAEKRGYTWNHRAFRILNFIHAHILPQDPKSA